MATLLAELADGPLAGLHTEISPTAPAQGLERSVPAWADSFLASELGQLPDRDGNWYIAVYDADENFEPAPGKGQPKRSYRFRGLRVIARESPAAAVTPASLPLRHRPATLQGPAAPLTLF